MDTSQNGRRHCVKDTEDVLSKLSEKITCQPSLSLSEGYGAEEENSGGNSSNLDPCFDLKPTEWCEEAARTGSCSQGSFRAVCFPKYYLKRIGSDCPLELAYLLGMWRNLWCLYM